MNRPATGSVPPPQVKICGLTTPDQARACARLGAAAVGLVFYPPSPRFVSDEAAREICRALPAGTAAVGVFVDEPFDRIIKTARACGLKGVQLHGRETPALCERLLAEGLITIKGLFLSRPPSFAEASRYPASAYLLECGAGRLPGGNAESWDWGAARDLAARQPVIVAGGLTPASVVQALTRSGALAADVSSGVEASPGVKDLEKVEQFLTAAAACGTAPERRIF